MFSSLLVQLKLLYRHYIDNDTRTRLRNIQYYIIEKIFYLKLKIFTFFKSTPTVQGNKIAYILPNSQISGGAAVVLQHANRLNKRGYEVFIITKGKSKKFNWFPQQECKVLNIDQIDKNTIKEFTIIVATAWDTAYDLMLMNVKHKFYFIQSDERQFYDSKSYLRKLVQNTYSFPFHMFTVANWIQNYLKEDFGLKSVVIPNGIDRKIFHQVKSKKRNKKRILIEGAIDYQFKNIDKAYIIASKTKADLWIASYEGKPKENWIYNQFFYKTPMSKMKSIYSQTDILLKLSLIEGFPGPPLEMMACGGVCVCSNIPGFREYIKHEYNGILVNPEDEEEILFYLNKLLNNEKYYKKIQKNALQTVNAMDWSKTIDLLETEIKKFIN